MNVTKRLWEQWLIAKSHAEDEYLKQGHPGIAEKYRLCNLFKGTETLQELSQLVFHPQAIEFMLKQHFPTMASIRMFAGVSNRLAELGIYLDAGEIELINPERCMLIGRTFATIRIDECSKHTIVMMRGSKCNLFLSGWAVAKVEREEGCQITRTVLDNAIVL